MRRDLCIYLFLIAFYLIMGDRMYSQSTNCGTATSIPLSGTNICVNGTTVGAIQDTITYGACNVSPNNTVWYTYVTTGSTNTFAVTPGTFTNPEIVLFLGCPGVG